MSAEIRHSLESRGLSRDADQTGRTFSGGCVKSARVSLTAPPTTVARATTDRASKWPTPFPNSRDTVLTARLRINLASLGFRTTRLRG